MSELIKRLEEEQDTLKRHAPKVWVEVDRQNCLKLFTDCKEALQQSQWVSVEDELPETEVAVLCWHPDWSIQLGWLTTSNHLLIGLTGDEATHWVSLPQQPAEQESKLLTDTHFPDLDEQLSKLSITL